MNTKICLNCQRVFDRNIFLSDVSWLKTKFCGRECSGKWRRGKSRSTEHRGTAKATVTPSGRDIAWAAGIYEGEGNVGVSDERYIRVLVTQKDTWLLFRLQKLFGGRVSARDKRACHYWAASGPRARGFIYTIFPYLSPRRQNQLKAALGLPAHDHVYDYVVGLA